MVRSLCTAFILVCVCCVAIARAQTEPSPSPTSSSASIVPTDDQWHYAVIPYLWLPDINAESNFQTPGILPGSPGNVTIGTEVTPGKYLAGLNFAIQVSFEARRKGTTLLGDYMNMNVSTSSAKITTITGPLGNEHPINSSVNAHVFTGLGTLAVGFTSLASWNSNLDIIAGLRWLSGRVSADYSLTGPIRQIPISGSVGGSAFLMDAIVGLKGRVGIGDRFYVPYEADIGTGNSNNTWQYLVGLAYAGRTNDLSAGFRSLGFNQTNGQLLQSLRLHGPYVALRIHW